MQWRRRDGMYYLCCMLSHIVGGLAHLQAAQRSCLPSWLAQLIDHRAHYCSFCWMSIAAAQHSLASCGTDCARLRQAFDTGLEKGERADHSLSPFPGAEARRHSPRRESVPQMPICMDLRKSINFLRSAPPRFLGLVTACPLTLRARWQNGWLVSNKFAA